MKIRNVVIGIAAGIGVLLLVGLVAGIWLWGRNTGGYGMMGGYGSPWGMHGFGGMLPLGGGILMLALWGALIALAVWLVRALFPRAGRLGPGPSNQDQDPGEILDRRYARGEISREEHGLMKETLSRSREGR